jgi:hypothetical protein
MGYWLKKQKKKATRKTKTQGVDYIKNVLTEIGGGGVYWMGLVQNRYRWRALVNTVINPQVP